MSAIYSDYAVQQILLEQKDGSGTIPTAYHAALFTTTPSLAFTGGVEIDSGTYTWYARQAMTLGSPSGRTQATTATITFTSSATVAVPTPILSLGWMDDPTAGHLWIIVPLAVPITIGIGSQVIFPAGQITASFSSS